MTSTTADQNNEKTEVSALSLATKQMQTDALLGEMVRIWTTLSPSQKEALMQKAIRASQLNQAIAHLPAIKMEVLNRNALKGNDNECTS